MRALVLIMLATLAGLGLKPGTAGAEETRGYIVAYDPAVRDVDRETDQRERSIDFEAALRYEAALEGFAAELTSEQVAALLADPDVAFVSRDRPVRALAAAALASGEAVPVGMRRIGAATATTVGRAANAPVAVLDTGIDLDNPELDVRPGTDCTGSGSPDDLNGHGTHVAGIIAARNDGRGVVGVAPGTPVIPVKVLDASGVGTTSQVICGIDWVTQNAAAKGIKVANMSLGGLDPSGIGTCATNAQRRAICLAGAAGVTFVVAAGNDGWDFGQNPPDVPAAYPEVLTVTALSDSDGAPGAAGGPPCGYAELDDGPASFSNYATSESDSAHTVAAPGMCVRSLASGGGLATMSGTSQASPHVAGAVATCLGSGGAAGPCAGLSPAKVIERVRARAVTAGRAFGFRGDPFDPLGASVFGPAVRAGAGAATAGVTAVSDRTARAEGTVFPDGRATSYRVEYGPTTAYGRSTADALAGSGDFPVAVGDDLADLAPGSTYHYRLVASGPDGASVGADRSFTTAPAPTPAPIVSSPSPSPSPAPAAGVAAPPASSRPSAVCRTWQSRLAAARRRLASAKRVARRAPSTAGRKRVKRASGDVARARREVLRLC